MTYHVVVELPTVIMIDADNSEEAVKKVIDNLIQSQQIKPADPIKVLVAEEGDIDN